ncbi:SAV_915 family protein [Streptomyces sp. NRRL B-24484]|uniref:SAV_915 family protein n=1 Tax=Streptomyces sp. NRRL B-24484 TaxID=1463833 RepID=UPI000998B800|nr:SAV_915 family protein [Streptomyces sp. NRRL B-24484]
MTTDHTAPEEPDDPEEPEEPEESGRPGARALRFVPVRTTGPVQVLRLFRLRDGSRCAVAFSTAAALHALLGPDHEVAELTEPTLRGLTAPLGIDRLVLDPGLVAPRAGGTRLPAVAALPSLSGAERPLVHRR